MTGETITEALAQFKAELTEEIRAMLAATPPEALLWDVQTAAKLMGISERTLWTMTKNGEVPHVRIGHRVFYEPQDIRDWIKRKKVVSGDSDSSRVE